jgi:hypothetical protein
MPGRIKGLVLLGILGILLAGGIATRQFSMDAARAVKTSAIKLASIITINPDNPYKLRALIRYPGYRNTIFPGQAKRCDVRIGTIGNGTINSGILTINVTVQNSDKSVNIKQSKPYDGSWIWNDVSLNLTNATPGSYQVKVEAVKAVNQSRVFGHTFDVNIASLDTPLPKVYIDEYNRTVKDGQLFFPLGYYTSHADTSIMDNIVETGFNTMMSYGLPSQSSTTIDGALKNAEARNLNVIFSLKDTFDNTKWAIKNWRDPAGAAHTGGFDIMQALAGSFKDKDQYPALLAWYIGDELDVKYLPQLQERYDWLRQNDYDHPVWQVVYKGQSMSGRLNTTDILGVDHYPIRQYKLNDTKTIEYINFTLASWTAMDASMYSRPLWMVPECKSDTGVRPATYTEMINYAYQGLVNGARGLIYYNLDNLLHDPDSSAQADESLRTMKQVGDHLNALVPIALGIDASPEQSLSPKDGRIYILTRVVGNDLYALAVNPFDQAISTTFISKSSITEIAVGLPGNPERTISPEGSMFSDDFGPLETRVYRIK